MFQRRLLQDESVAVLSEGAMTVLEQVGIYCESAELLAALADWGAQVDHSKQVVRFPRQRVEAFAEALRAEAVSRGADSGPFPFRAPSRPALGTQVAQFIYDDRACESRAGGRADLIRLTQLGEVLHGAQGVGHSLLLRDVPPLLEPLEAALLLTEYASQPQGAFAWDVRQVDYLAEMGAILGFDHWYTMGAICIAHPLRFDRVVAERFVRMARAGESMGLTGMPVAGATTPVTVAGFVVESSAEFVAAWIAARALNPAVPLGGSIWAGTVDMKGGTVSYSAPDAMLRAFTLSEFLRRWCDVHVQVGGGEYASAREPGLYAALEKAYKAMTIAAFSGRHPSVGQGMYDDGRGISAAQLLLDRELTIGLESLGQGLDFTPEALGLESILEVGFGFDRSHLETVHTRQHFRESLWLPSLWDRSGWDGAAAEAEVWRKAVAEVETLLAQYRKPEVDPDKLARMRQVVERARRVLLG